MTWPVPGVRLHAGLERLASVGGREVLSYFQPGAADRPLIVFLPGGGHLARVCYGHPGADPTEFLAHALAAQGFPLLALSYPSTNNVFPHAHPDLTIGEWAAAAAAVTAQVTADERLGGQVVVCAWSMGGRTAHPFTTAARQLGLHVDCFIALAASAPMLARGPFPDGTAPLNADGLWDYSGYGLSREAMYRTWYRQVTDPDEGGGPIMTEQEYHRYYCGLHSVGLRGELQIFDGTSSVTSLDNYETASGHGRWEEFPLCAAIAPTSRHDAISSLTNHLRWPLVTMEKLARTLPASAADRWPEILRLAHRAPEILTRTVPGNHFFFLGRRGAHATAEAIVELITATGDLWHRATGRSAARSMPETWGDSVT
ncbi:hypothetical protein ACWEKM_19830 [Streptomyces sp. NPDC004752]